ncbi:cell wall-binding repeat-containing protein [Streptomyces brasiliensis]|uniref:cell wall-binding repeat-containing protein n=1 Tax=Streptomyces brasiliensis TaxID=1954 RepID=UPI001E4A1D62|nr:cell wall-binding repeat-containing protein [Streptomyces brasiliensis]
MRLFTRRHAAALATAAVLAATGTLATAPGAVADDAGSWPGTEGKILVDGGKLIDPATGTVTTLANASGTYSAWAPDGSRFVNSAGQIRSYRPSGSTPITLPRAEGVRSSAAYEDLAYGWGGRYVVFSTGGQLAYGPSDGAWAPEPLLSDAQEPSTVCDTDPTVNDSGLVAFARGISSCSDNDGVYVYDGSANTVKRVLTDARQPAWSPDGTKLAFVRGDADGKPQVFTANADGTEVKQVTTGPGYYGNPSWSPTGTRIVFDAYSLDSSADLHSTQYIDLATGELTTVAAKAPGSNPSWQPLRKNTTGRVWGADAYATNIASSRWSWNTVGTSQPGLLDAKTAVLVNQDDVSYALTAPTLAGKQQGPVLTTPKTGLSTAVKNELKRTLKPGAGVWMLGGTSILSSNVAAQLKALGYVPKRVAGADRYETSVKVAKLVTTAPKYVFLASGTNYKAALPAAAAAGADGTGSAGSLVLTSGNKLSSAVKSYLNGLNPDKTMVIAVGSDAKYALTHSSFSRWPSTYSYYPVTASTDVGLSVAVAKFWWTTPSQVSLAYAGSWRDGVSAGSAMNIYGPLLWTSRPALSSEVKSYLLREAAGTQAAVAFGDTGSVTVGALNTSGSSISANGNMFVYRPYLNGVEATSKQALSLTTAGAEPGGPAKVGPAASEPNLDSVRTTHRQ